MVSLDLAARIAHRDRTDIRRANAVRDKCVFAAARGGKLNAYHVPCEAVSALDLTTVVLVPLLSQPGGSSTGDSEF